MRPLVRLSTQPMPFGPVYLGLRTEGISRAADAHIGRFVPRSSWGIFAFGIPGAPRIQGEGYVNLVCERPGYGQQTMRGREDRPATPGKESSDKALHVLLVEDSTADAELVLRELRRGGFTCTNDIVRTPDQFRRSIERQLPDVVLADYNLGQWRGMDALKILRDEGLHIPLILVSGALGDVTAVECIKQGVTDYVLKESLTRLPVSIRRALKERQLREQRKDAEAELAAKVAELARSNRDLEQFAYVASHDLQEPLRMVAAYTQLLADRYRGKLDQEADKYIRYAVEGAERMQALILDLLAFSRAGRQGMEVTETDVHTVVERALANLDSTARESNVIVNYGDLPSLPANGGQLQQVFQNLIANAIKFRGQEPPVVDIAAEHNAGEWVFSVTDNGIGIPQEHLESIFEIFQRLHTREEYSGNGIGLAICKRIVERHGGRIWAESQSGQGTTFKFTLPATVQSLDTTSSVEERAMAVKAAS